LSDRQIFDGLGGYPDCLGRLFLTITFAGEGWLLEAVPVINNACEDKKEVTE
jgi:hypothetical protein